MAKKEMIRVLVTGCAGFIGSHLTERLLKEGFEVIGIDCFTDYYPREIKEANMASAMNHKNFDFIEGNLLKMREYPLYVDYVFHLAAQAGVRASWGKSFGAYTRNNIEATQRLLEFYKGEEIKKFAYASSSSVYGNTELPMKEDSLLKPVSPYGVTKLAGEFLCRLYWENYGIPSISLRYFTVYGPRQRPDMAIHKFVRAILKGEEITVYGDGTQTRDFTFVDDVVEATVLAATSIWRIGVFNVGGGSRISVNNLIEKIESITGKRVRIKHVGEQEGDVTDTLADISEISMGLNWKPKVKMEEGLKRFVEWFTSGKE